MSCTREIQAGVVGGTRLPGNVRTLLTNVRRLLEDHQTTFELELVVSDGVDTPEGYRPVDPGFDDPDRGLDALRILS